MSTEQIESIFGHKVRVRVMGIYLRNGEVLLLKHKGLNDQNELWLPPGGGLEFGESLEECLQREFKEELNVEVEVGEFLFFHEFRSVSLHAIEMFFCIESMRGEMELGHDPELTTNQMISEHAFWSLDSIKNHSSDCFHSVFQKLRKMEELLEYQGFFNFRNNV